jgi:hypothetical protein
MRDLQKNGALTKLRRLVFPPRRPEFDPRWSNVGFVVTKVALG